MENLAGKVVVVTGGAGGIGHAMAQAFAGEGAKVVLADIEEEALAKAVAQLPESAEAIGVECDVRDADAVASLAATAVDRFGAVHVVCNNAGVVANGRSWEVSADRFNWVVGVNLIGVANGIRAFVPRMIEQGEGHVVNTASAAGLVTGPTMASYFASKHGVVALTEALAYDLALAGVTGVGCTVLCPEGVRTRIHEAERNLPDGIAPASADDSGAAEGRAFLSAIVESGIEPAEVAAKVVDAVKTNRFYVLPHGDSTLQMARSRWDAIAENRPPLLGG
jgi:NAD(P)-dependent dehydrogenase (short-subunit alcohol dehydrogenase family)